MLFEYVLQVQVILSLKCNIECFVSEVWTMCLSRLHVVESIVLIECSVSEVLTMCPSGLNVVESIVFIEWYVSEVLTMCTSGTHLVESIVLIECSVSDRFTSDVYFRYTICWVYSEV